LAVTRRNVARHTSISRLIIGVTILAAVIATAPIIGAAFGVSAPRVSPRTAFASAPSGNYAVVARTDGTHDVIGVAWAGNGGAITEVARVPHLDGMGITGAVSPDGARVAAVAIETGTATRPVASLVIIDLVTGELFRAALRIDPGQVPVWAPDGASVVVTRAIQPDAVATDVQVLRVSLRGTEDVLWTVAGVLGVYPLGFERSGALLAVAIDGSGSTVLRDGQAVVSLGPWITRDWQLSPDGSQLGYIEANVEDGIRYLARRISLAEGGVTVQALGADVEALGVAWNPRTGSVAYGAEPGAEGNGVSAQALRSESGFDVPLGFAADGTILAVAHWTGEDFTQPGAYGIELVDGGGRTAIADYTRFLGWARR